MVVGQARGRSVWRICAFVVRGSSVMENSESGAGVARRDKEALAAAARPVSGPLSSVTQSARPHIYSFA